MISYLYLALEGDTREMFGIKFTILSLIAAEIAKLLDCHTMLLTDQEQQRIPRQLTCGGDWRGQRRVAGLRHRKTYWYMPRRAAPLRRRH